MSPAARGRVLRAGWVLATAALTVTGCTVANARRGGMSTPPLASASTLAAPGPTSGATGAEPDVGAAIRAAIAFQLGRCAWDWHEPYPSYLSAQASVATPRYAAQLRATDDPESWYAEVIAQQQVVSCAIERAWQISNAPNTATAVYVRLVAEMHVSSRRGSFDTGPLTAAWRLVARGGRWLVDGPVEGG
jgi:hypothetical protein